MILHCHLFSLLWVSYFFELEYFCGVQHGGHLQNPRAVNPPQPWVDFYGFARKAGPFSVKCPVGLGGCFFLTYEVKRLPNLIYRITMEWFPGSTFGCMQVYHGMLHINRANQEQLTYSIENNLSRNNRIFNGCCNWVIILVTYHLL